MLFNFYWFVVLKQYFKVCRVESWFGWIFNFGLGSILFTLPRFEQFVFVFFAFSLSTASIFVLNQYFDRIADRENEVKSNLPISSGRITPRRALLFSLLLILVSFVLVFKADSRLSPLFFIYLGLCTAYSSPPLRLKTVPIADIAVSGIGAGFLPFLIGLGAAQQLNASFSIILLSALPLIFFHSGTHIVQAVGDYEADKKTQVSTFVVRYGRRTSVLVAGIMFLAASLSPFVYLALGLISPGHLIFFFAILPLLVTLATGYTNLMRNPTTSNVLHLNKMARKYGTIALTILWVYIFVTKTIGF